MDKEKKEKNRELFVKFKPSISAVSIAPCLLANSCVTSTRLTKMIKAHLGLCAAFDRYEERVAIEVEKWKEEELEEQLELIF